MLRIIPWNSSVPKAVAYIRVSSLSQGKSGFGLQAQEAEIGGFAQSSGYDVVKVFREVGSAKGSDNLERRPELSACLQQAKRDGVPVLIAGLDRLSRETSDLERILRDPRLEIIDVRDWPQFGPLVLQRDEARIARVAKETELLSKRTKEGLRRAKQQGKVLGNPRIREAQEKGAAANRSAAQQRDRELEVMVNQIREGGIISAVEIAKVLNEKGVRPRRGQIWTAPNLRRLLRRIEAVRPVQEPDPENPLWGIF
jgi:DNA invertase Pin-like site-specific DNA recombinase